MTRRDWFFVGFAIVVAVMLIIGLTSCAGATQDADTSGQSVDRSPAEVIAMPDQFPNVAHKCDGHGHRVFSNGHGLFVIPDAACGRGR